MLARNRASQLALVAAVATLMTACLPYLRTGYEVIGTGDRVRSQYVWFIQDSLRMRAHNGVTILISAFTESSGGLDVRLEMDIPKGSRTRWLASDVTYRSPAWDKPRSGGFSDVIDYRGGQWKPTDYLEGTRSGGWWDNGALYYTSLGSAEGRNLIGDSDNPIQEFSIDLPQLEIDGKPFDPGTITVRRFKRLGVDVLAQ